MDRRISASTSFLDEGPFVAATVSRLALPAKVRNIGVVSSKGCCPSMRLNLYSEDNTEEHPPIRASFCQCNIQAKAKDFSEDSRLAVHERIEVT
jgi:hypothetical protein